MLLQVIVAVALDMARMAPGDASVPAGSAREFVERFVRVEFEGDEDRFERIRFSAKHEKSTGDLDPTAAGKVFQAVWSPFVAVRSFEILDVETLGARGRARVRYECVAESPGRCVVRDLSDRVCVTELRLVREGESWFVLDPPPAHVSINQLTEAYRNEMKLFAGDWAARASRAQLAYRASVEEGLRALERIALTAGGR